MALPERVEVPQGSLSLTWDGAPSEDIVMLGHGAGAGKDSDFMTTAARGIAEAGYLVCRFNFLYAERGRKAPDRADLLESTYARVMAELRAALQPRAMFIGGKSMGGRIASHLLAAGTEAAGLLLLGYPLHPPGRPDRVRAAHLGDIGAPMLFVEGTRDPFCPLDSLRAVLARTEAEWELAVIDDGDHSFKVRKSSGRSTADAWAEVVAVSTDWIARHTPA